MTDQILTESRRHLLELSDSQATSLRSLGRQLASSKQYWGAQDEEKGGPAEEGGGDRSVVRCVHRSGHTYEVTVAEAVGIIVLPDLQLIIEPKVPLRHFEYLLARSPSFPRVGADLASMAGAPQLWDLVASWFLGSLEALLRDGLLSDYEERSDDLPAVRGTIRIAKTASKYYRGSTLVSCDFEEFGLDTPLNRILHAAALAVAQTPFLEQTLRRRARRATARFEDVGELRSTDLRVAVDRHTTKYSAPLALARHVLAATGRTFASGRHHAHTFLIRTPELVEDAVRQILREGLTDVSPVTKKGLQLVGSKVTLNPDLVFGSVATGDVKYKLLAKDWKRSDLYQAVAFATGYRVDHAAIVTFSTGSDEVPAPLQVGRVALRVIAWDCSVGSRPEASAQALVNDTAQWLTAVMTATQSPVLINAN